MLFLRIYNMTVNVLDVVLRIMQDLSDLPPSPRLDAAVFACCYVSLFKNAHGKRVSQRINPVKDLVHFLRYRTLAPSVSAGLQLEIQSSIGFQAFRGHSFSSFAHVNKASGP